MADRSRRPDLGDPEQALGVMALPLHDAAALIGAYRWAEERLFALTGRWAADPAVGPDAQLHLFEASAQHAWHAGLWAERLPVLDGFDREEAARPVGSVLEPLLDALEDEPAATGRLAGLARVVVPELAAAYRHHLGRAVPVTDAPVIRTLHLVLADLAAEEAALERVVARAGEEVGVARAAVRRLEAVLEASEDPAPGGAAPGPGVTRPVRLVPWPGEERSKERGRQQGKHR